MILGNSILNFPGTGLILQSSICKRQIANSIGEIHVANFADQVKKTARPGREPATPNALRQMRVCEQLPLHGVDLSVNDAVAIHLRTPRKRRLFYGVRECFRVRRVLDSGHQDHQRGGFRFRSSPARQINSVNASIRASCESSVFDWGISSTSTLSKIVSPA